MKSLESLNNTDRIQLLITDGYENIIASIGIGEDEKENFILLDANSTDKLNLHKKVLDNEENLIQSIRTKRGWIYHFAKPLKKVMVTIPEMQNMLIIVCAFALVANLILSVLFYKFIFKLICMISDLFMNNDNNEVNNNISINQRIIAKVDAMIEQNK